MLDEVHYLQDAYRGPVWEEVIVHLPAAVRLVCLSATVSNAPELADWISTVRGPTSVVVEDKRPVTLDNWYLVEDTQAGQMAMLPDPRRRQGQPGRQPLRHRPPRRVAGPGRWPTPPSLSPPPAGSTWSSCWPSKEMLPAIYFIFSRAACDDAVTACIGAGLRLHRARGAGPHPRRSSSATWPTSATTTCGSSTTTAGSPRSRPASPPTTPGWCPPFKEAVEACFVEGLVKVVFATETLALGINMPARTVVIEKLTKFTGERHEFLTPGQYTQLTGRAGRRGIDDHGHAVVLWNPFVTFDEVAGLAASRSFRLTQLVPAHLQHGRQPGPAVPGRRGPPAAQPVASPSTRPTPRSCGSSSGWPSAGSASTS